MIRLDADTLAVVASGIFLVRLLPQPIRLVRSGVAAGVSPLAALNGVTSAAAWTAYGLSARLPIVWAVSALALVPNLITVAMLRRRTTSRDVAIAMSWIAFLGLTAALGLFGAALALGVLVTQGPAVWRAVREPDLSGLSPATWWISVLDAATWGAYGLVIGDHALLGYGVVLAGSAAVVLGRIWWTSEAAGTTDAVTSPA